MSRSGTSANHRFEKIGALREHHAHQQPAVRAALNAQMFWRSHLTSDQILGHRDEVVVRTLTIFFTGRVVPIGSELTPPRMLANT